jgi:adenine-specific DNA-methyltransferase
MSHKQRLELDWLGKDQEAKLEPRILLHDIKKSFGDKDSNNMLIHGDNLLALRALEQDFTNKIKCIFIDPPYNTGSAFEQYDDGIEHSLWLSLIRDRLVILRKLLSDDGSIWITLDDNEAHYCKVLCDEIFGRSNFVSNVIWEKADSPRMDAKYFSSRHDHILVYAKDKEKFHVNQISTNGETPEHYDKIDEQGRKYYLKPLRAMGVDGRREARPTMYFSVTAPDGTEVFPKNPDGSDSRWRWKKEKVESDKDRLDWVNGRNGWSLYYRLYANEDSTVPPETIWSHTEVGSNRTSKKEAKDLTLKGESPFATPKPEALLSRIIHIATNKGDYVLDSFAGSGTTGAVAHKMQRKWIMIEFGDHCFTHIVPRLKSVISGQDKGGVSKQFEWNGGGGFNYYDLAPSLLQKDDRGNWIINDNYNALQLAEAVCKHEKFKFHPHESVFWKQGYSSENDFIFITTQFLTAEQLDHIHSQMKKSESLLICAKAFKADKDKYKNITIKKIPQMLLGRCEFGRDDYSLNVKEMVQEELDLNQ